MSPKEIRPSTAEAESKTFDGVPLDSTAVSGLSPLARRALAEIRRILAQRPRHFRPGPGTLSRWELGLPTRPDVGRAYPRVDLREGRWSA